MFVITKNIIHKADCRKIKSEFVTADIADLSNNKFKKCKCCAKEIASYLEYAEISEKNSRFVQYCNEAAKTFNYSITVLENEDIEITTNIEKWIISVIDFNNDNSAKITLYHKNNLQFDINKKCGNIQYPGYHVQFTSVMLPMEIINYVMKHEKNKWGAGVKVAQNVKGVELSW